MSATAPVVLIADDTTDDIFMLRWALLRAQLSCDLRAFSDGRDVIDYLSGTGMFGERSAFPFPVATILDCHLPGISGFGVLGWIRKQPKLQNHPVVLVTGSARELDEIQARKLGATCYFEKTSQCQNIIEFLRQYLPATHTAKAA